MVRNLVILLIIVLTIFPCAKGSTIEELLKKAEERDYKLTSLLYQEKAGKYRIEQYKAQGKPQVSISTYFGWQEYKPYYSDQIRQSLKYYYLVLKQPIYHPEIKAKIEQSQLYSNIDKLKVLQEKQYIRYLLITDLIHLGYSQKKEELYRELVEIEKERLARLKELFQRKKATEEDLLEVDRAYQEAKFSLRESKLDLENTLKSIELLVGKFRNIKPSLKLTNSLKPLLNQAKELRKEIKENFEVKIADENIKIAQNEIKIRSYGRYPKVDLSLSYSYTSSSAISVASKDKRIALTLDFPIYQGGLVTAQKLEALALKKAAIADKENILMQKKLQFEDSFGKLKEAYEKLNYLRRKLEIDTRLIKLNKEGVQLGVKTAFDLLSSKETYLRDKISVLEEIHAGLTAYIEILYLTANLTEDKIEPINSWFDWIKCRD